MRLHLAERVKVMLDWTARENLSKLLKNSLSLWERREGAEAVLLNNI